jgi:site-specific DNA-cytosine methylase
VNEVAIAFVATAGKSSSSTTQTFALDVAHTITAHHGRNSGEDVSATEAPVAPTLTTDANRPARTMTVVAQPFAFDEAQITSAANRSTVSPGGPVPTMSANSRLRVASESLVPRRLTPREVERCFGFPDDYTLVPGASNSARYKALGNSMAVPVMRWIGRRLLMVDGIVRGKVPIR